MRKVQCAPPDIVQIGLLASLHPTELKPPGGIERLNDSRPG
jgi:hypothetical protein